MKHVEKIGLVKFDFLGLRNLTVIDNTLRLIRLQSKEPPDLANIDFNDAPTYQVLGAGNTTGVFQLESSGMKDLLVRMKPESFRRCHRPWWRSTVRAHLDSGMVDDFVERKHGRKAVEYMLPGSWSRSSRRPTGSSSTRSR